jgi:preprotein translocase subunit SecE
MKFLGAVQLNFLKVSWPIVEVRRKIFKVVIAVKNIYVVLKYFDLLACESF